MKKLIAAVIFLVAAFFGASTQTGLYGEISGFMTIIIIALSFGVMWYAVGLWKSSNQKQDKN